MLHRFDGGGLLAEGEREGRARARRGLRPDLAPVGLHDALYGHQADAGTFELGAVQALEDAERLARVLHVEADTLVTHEDHALSAALPGADGDRGPASRSA